MNVTQLAFTDEELQILVNGYIKILMYAIHIDGVTSKKEVKILFSLLTKVDLGNDSNFLGKLNFFGDEEHFDYPKIGIHWDHFDYVRVLDLENIIFHEGLKSLHIICKKLNTGNTRTRKEKMQRVQHWLESVKTVIEAKKEILGDEYIQVFYYGLYHYVEVIANQEWRWMKGKIVEEEQEFLDLIQTSLNIKNKPYMNTIWAMRTSILSL